jgi:signal transduction histidine kinase
MSEFKEVINKLKSRKIDFAAIKLSFFYTLIIMILSITFSISIFKMSSNELGRGLSRQTRILRDIPIADLPKPLQDMETLRLTQIEESNNRLQLNLIYFNLLILILSSCFSYFFAKKTLEPIQEAMETQNRFTADASHELRTPLTAMRSEIEVALRDKKLNLENSKKLLHSNLEEIEKLESLSSALLKLAKNENITNTFQEVELEEIIVSAFEKVENMAEKKSIEFINSLQKVRVKGDRGSLIELFVILLDNAIKYSHNYSKIFINISKNDGKAIVAIKDEGVGIKASDLPFIFNRFYRADNSRNKEKIPGYGLGLSIAKQIIDLHNGEITVASKPGKGSEFILTLLSN